MRCAHIVSGVVANVILADPTTFTYGDGSLVVATDTAQVGDSYASGVFTSVAPVATYQTSGLTFLQFMGLFTQVEQAAIIGSADVSVKTFTLMAASSPSLDLTNAQVVTGIDYLASISLIQPARVADILAGKSQ